MMNQAPPKDCPQAVFDAVLDTPEPDKWIDCGEVRPLPMFHMHTMMKYAEKCVFTAVTHGVKMEWQPIETAPSDTPVLLYTPNLHFSNPERIESRVYHDSRAGSRHAWATHWMPLPKPPELARATAQKG